MNKKIFFLALISAIVISSIADAQVIMRRRAGGRLVGKDRRHIQQRLPEFEPTVNISVGYGFPNIDKTYLPEYYDVYPGTVSQSGPFTGSLDYQFSRRMSIGIMVTHGTVSAPYYDYYSSSEIPVFKARLESWSFMFNLIRYIPISQKATPYMRTAIGINSWEQDYTDANGNKIAIAPVGLPDLAYQAGIGAKFNLSKKAGLYVEAGYGKYILHGGLSVKF